MVNIDSALDVIELIVDVGNCDNVVCFVVDDGNSGTSIPFSVINSLLKNRNGFEISSCFWCDDTISPCANITLPFDTPTIKFWLYKRTGITVSNVRNVVISDSCIIFNDDVIIDSPKRPVGRWICGRIPGPKTTISVGEH